MQVSTNLKTAYANQYDSSTTAWRNLAAKYKAENIVALAKHIQFSNVLEVGAGEGSILNWLSQWHFSEQMYALEISESGAAIIQSKNIPNLKNVQIFDGYKIPYPDQHFDLVICSHVMEHVEHERTLLREIKRVSKYQIFEVPIDFSFYVDRKAAHYLSYGHINIYTPSLFRFLLKSEQFDIVADQCSFYKNEVLKHIYRDNQVKYVIAKIKKSIIQLIPYLFGIKPNAYTILTSATANSLDVFGKKG